MYRPGVKPPKHPFIHPTHLTIRPSARKTGHPSRPLKTHPLATVLERPTAIVVVPNTDARILLRRILALRVDDALLDICSKRVKRLVDIDV